MDKKIHPILYGVCNYLFMLVLELKWSLVCFVYRMPPDHKSHCIPVGPWQYTYCVCYFISNVPISTEFHMYHAKNFIWKTNTQLHRQKSAAITLAMWHPQTHPGLPQELVWTYMPSQCWEIKYNFMFPEKNSAHKGLTRYSDVTWTPCFLNSTGLVVHHLFQPNIKENIKAQHCYPF